MELREFAESVLFANTLEEKLQCPQVIVDVRPGPAIVAPDFPGRPAELRFKATSSSQSDFPGLHELEDERERGKLLHFFANHELLATELMALVLLRFPDAPPAFRLGVLQTLKDEQRHTRFYLERMRACGIHLGELPVSGYFWRCISGMENPIDYVAGLCLTFEQANLDFCRHFANGFARVGDLDTSKLLDRIYHDEIGHVAYGLKWFRRWKNPQESDWEAFCRQLKFPLSPRRAKGHFLNVEGRRAAGLDPEFIAELDVYSRSRGRTPAVFVFNPFSEAYVAQGPGFCPGKRQSALARDLSNLPQFLSRQDDVLLLPKRPPVEFLSTIKQAGFPLPEFVELDRWTIPEQDPIRQRKIGGLRPWAWGPDSVELFEPLISNLTREQRAPGDCFNDRIALLYSKAWSAAMLRRILETVPSEPWLCSASEVGEAVDTPEAATAAVKRIRSRGHHRVVIKQAHGLAGHNSIRLWEPELLETQLRWIDHALQSGRQLVVEPWLERQLDFSLQLEMKSDGLKLLGYTGLINDLRGQFQANWAAPDFTRRVPAPVMSLFRHVPDFAGRLQALYRQILAVLAAEFRRAGFLGPVGIDAFVYADAKGQPCVKPIVEINPRYTMGRLTLELMRHAAPGCWGLFRLVNLAQIKSDGFEDIAAYARALLRDFPVCLEGEPAPKIRSGIVCLNDPATAEVCLSTFKVACDSSGIVPK